MPEEIKQIMYRVTAMSVRNLITSLYLSGSDNNEWLKELTHIGTRVRSSESLANPTFFFSLLQSSSVFSLYYKHT